MDGVFDGGEAGVVVDLTRMPTDGAIRQRRNTCVAKVEAFLRRTADEGLLRRDQPRG